MSGNSKKYEDRVTQRYRTVVQKRVSVKTIKDTIITVEPHINEQGIQTGTKITAEYDGPQIFDENDSIVLGKVILENTGERKDAYVPPEPTPDAKKDPSKGCAVGCSIVAVIGTAALVSAIALGARGCSPNSITPTEPTASTEPPTVIVGETWEGRVNCFFETDVNTTIYNSQNPYQLQDVYSETEFKEYQKLIKDGTIALRQLSDARYYRDSASQWSCAIDVAKSLQKIFDEQKRLEEEANASLISKEGRVDLEQANADSIEMQMNKTEHNIGVVDAIVGMADDVRFLTDTSEADLIRYGLEVNSVQFNDITGDARIDINGDIKTEYTCVGKTQDEVYQQILEHLKNYKPCDETMGLTVEITQKSGDDKKYIFRARKTYRNTRRAYRNNN